MLDIALKIQRTITKIIIVITKKLLKELILKIIMIRMNLRDLKSLEKKMILEKMIMYLKNCIPNLLLLLIMKIVNQNLHFKELCLHYQNLVNN
jgi:hypothetical protein